MIVNRRYPSPLLSAVGVLFLLGSFFNIQISMAKTLVVDATNPKTADTNPGTAEQPFATVARGLQSLSPGDTLLIKAGTYRESAKFEGNGTTDKPITVAAFPGDEGKVVITGSDLITNWKVLSPIVYTTPWNLSLDSKYPEEWIKKTAVGDYGPYAKRCEMVFINGQSIQEVLSTGQMRRGTFTIDETRHVIRLAMPDASTKLQEAEVSVRQQGLKVHGDHLIIRGLNVIHVANPYFSAALDVKGDDNVIEKCRAEWNNLDGIKLEGHRILATHNISNHNGETGMSLTIQDSRIEFNETDANAWRYGPGWAEGGIKCIGGNPAGNTFLGHISKDNLGAGIWLDTCGGNNRIERCWLENNEVAGLEFEACLGDNFAANNVITKTRGIPNALYPEADGAGIMLYETGNVTMGNNTLADNEHDGIIFAGAERGTAGSGRTCTNETVVNNIIANNGWYGISFWVRGIAAEPAALATYHIDYNLWSQPDGKFALIPPRDLNISSLTQWQQQFKQDAHSVATDPRFVAPKKGDYHLQSTSLAKGKGTTVDLATDFDSNPRHPGSPTIGAYAN